jgi:hypothetical protein
MGHHQSLLVTEGSSVVGVLRLTDVYEFVAGSWHVRFRDKTNS